MGTRTRAPRATKEKQSPAAAVAVGDIVKIKKGTVYGAATPAVRHKIVPDYLLGYTYTVEAIKTANGVTIARLSKICADFPTDRLVKIK